MNQMRTPGVWLGQARIGRLDDSPFARQSGPFALEVR